MMTEVVVQHMCGIATWGRMMISMSALRCCTCNCRQVAMIGPLSFCMLSLYRTYYAIFCISYGYAPHSTLSVITSHVPA